MFPHSRSGIGDSIRRKSLVRYRVLFVSISCLAAFLLSPHSVDAEVAPRLARIVLADSPDYPDITFVCYNLKPLDPWSTGIRVDPATATIVPINTEVPVALMTMHDPRLVVIAVQRSVAKMAKDRPDPAWLQPSATGVVRVPGVFTPPTVYRDVVLRYRLEKTDKGPKLTLLNPDVLKAAKKYPLPPGDMTRESKDPAALKSSWLILAGGGLLCGLLAGALLTLLMLNRRTTTGRDATQ